jgi:hypothetical protein
MATKVIVDVTAHPSGPPGVYSLVWRFDGQPNQPNALIDLPKNSGPCDMTFNLIDQSNNGLRFRQAASDAMWVRPGNQCPTGPGNGNNQMSGGVVSSDRMRLDINDKNSGNPRNLKYALRFEPDGFFYDPDIRNGGGGVGSGGTSAALVVGAIGAFAGLVATYLFTEAATTMNLLIGAVIGAGIGCVAGLVFNSVRERSSEGAPG